LPEPQREQLAHFVAACSQAATDFRWTPRDNLHLTVRFVGNVERTMVDAVAGALAQRPLATFDLQLGHVGTFGRGRTARVVWLGLGAGAEAATALAATVEEECVRAGLPAESRPYQAHLTLARARSREGSLLPGLPSMPRLESWRAGELVMYSSRLARTGAVYEAIRTLALV
jgi:2'-5' RNA ligase